jgi:hypothetical protein
MLRYHQLHHVTSFKIDSNFISDSTDHVLCTGEQWVLMTRQNGPKERNTRVKTAGVTSTRLSNYVIQQDRSLTSFYERGIEWPAYASIASL